MFHTNLGHYNKNKNKKYAHFTHRSVYISGTRS